MTFLQHRPSLEQNGASQLAKKIEKIMLRCSKTVDITLYNVDITTYRYASEILTRQDTDLTRVSLILRVDKI